MKSHQLGSTIQTHDTGIPSNFNTKNATQTPEWCDSIPTEFLIQLL